MAGGLRSGDGGGIRSCVEVEEIGGVVSVNVGVVVVVVMGSEESVVEPIRCGLECVWIGVSFGGWVRRREGIGLVCEMVKWEVLGEVLVMVRHIIIIKLNNRERKKRNRKRSLLISSW